MEEVNFVYYEPAAENQPPASYHTELLLKLFLQFQTLVLAGQKNILNQSMLQQVLSHSLTEAGTGDGNSSQTNQKKQQAAGLRRRIPSSIESEKQRLRRERRLTVDEAFLGSWIRKLTEEESKFVSQELLNAGILPRDQKAESGEERIQEKTAPSHEKIGLRAESETAGRLRREASSYEILRRWNRLDGEEKEKITEWIQNHVLGSANQETFRRLILKYEEPVRREMEKTASSRVFPEVFSVWAGEAPSFLIQSSSIQDSDSLLAWNKRSSQTDGRTTMEGQEKARAGLSQGTSGEKNSKQGGLKQNRFSLLWKDLKEREQAEEKQAQERLLWEGAGVLTFLRRKDLREEREEFLRLAAESAGSKAADRIKKYWELPAEKPEGVSEREKEIEPVLRLIARENQRQATVLYHRLEESRTYQEDTAAVSAKLEAMARIRGIRGDIGRGQNPEELIRLAGEQIGPEAVEILEQYFQQTIRNDRKKAGETKDSDPERNSEPTIGRVENRQEGNRQEPVQDALPLPIRELAIHSSGRLAALIQKSGILEQPEFWWFRERIVRSADGVSETQDSFFDQGNPYEEVLIQLRKQAKDPGIRTQFINLSERLLTSSEARLLRQYLTSEPDSGPIEKQSPKNSPEAPVRDIIQRNQGKILSLLQASGVLELPEFQAEKPDETAGKERHRGERFSDGNLELLQRENFAFPFYETVFRTLREKESYRSVREELARLAAEALSENDLRVLTKYLETPRTDSSRPDLFRPDLSRPDSSRLDLSQPDSSQPDPSRDWKSSSREPGKPEEETKHPGVKEYTVSGPEGKEKEAKAAEKAKAIKEAKATKATKEVEATKEAKIETKLDGNQEGSRNVDSRLEDKETVWEFGKDSAESGRKPGIWERSAVKAAGNPSQSAERSGGVEPAVRTGLAADAGPLGKTEMPGGLMALTKAYPKTFSSLLERAGIFDLSEFVGRLTAEDGGEDAGFSYESVFLTLREKESYRKERENLVRLTEEQMGAAAGRLLRSYLGMSLGKLSGEADTGTDCGTRDAETEPGGRSGGVHESARGRGRRDILHSGERPKERHIKTEGLEQQEKPGLTKPSAGLPSAEKITVRTAADFRNQPGVKLPEELSALIRKNGELLPSILRRAGISLSQDEDGIVFRIHPEKTGHTERLNHGQAENGPEESLSYGEYGALFSYLKTEHGFQREREELTRLFRENLGSEAARTVEHYFSAGQALTGERSQAALLPDIRPIRTVPLRIGPAPGRHVLPTALKEIFRGKEQAWAALFAEAGLDPLTEQADRSRRAGGQNEKAGGSLDFLYGELLIVLKESPEQVKTREALVRLAKERMGREAGNALEAFFQTSSEGVTRPMETSFYPPELRNIAQTLPSGRAQPMPLTSSVMRKRNLSGSVDPSSADFSFQRKVGSPALPGHEAGQPAPPDQTFAPGQPAAVFHYRVPPDPLTGPAPPPPLLHESVWEKHPVSKHPAADPAALDSVTFPRKQPPEPRWEELKPAQLKLLQSQTRRTQDLEAAQGRIEKLEEQIRLQETKVTQLSESQGAGNEIPRPDVGAITREVVKRLERELRLEKMRKGLL
ncbi:hypothetical protein MUB23_00615 [Cuneatibacter sp. NSJ-177]|uniref:hypothetical protein n=1 Tax=Cuneatibacter sp. NSJ-177 TaxID=2931401 RepID=UPI001FD1D5D5|nr:hypothetical protein [Cuneatibacter sp. NSJ-177]MCJ7833895.1 hypothetical protein [Cuneatibacter sp. NSJ-177]